MEQKEIKGQAWIADDRLMQDIILVLPNGKTANNTIALIPNIWDDLTSASSTAKTNGKGYFYWEYKMTDSTNDDAEVTVRIECPRPKDDMFLPPYKPEDAKSEWEKYWLTKYKNTYDNVEEGMTIQPKNIILPGTSYVDYSNGGQTKTVEEIKKPNTDIGDITNLLDMF